MADDGRLLHQTAKCRYEHWPPEIQAFLTRGIYVPAYFLLLERHVCVEWLPLTTHNSPRQSEHSLLPSSVLHLAHKGFLYIIFHLVTGQLVVQALCCKREGRGFDTRWVKWIFSSYIINLAAPDPGVYSASNRNGPPLWSSGQSS
jgi:hypothetical protein